MKKKPIRSFLFSRMNKKLLIMKFIIFFMLANIIQVTASVYSQNTILTLDLEEVDIEKVFKKIEEQSEFHFLYRSNLFKDQPAVNINVKEKTVEEILKKIIDEKKFFYEIDDNTIIMREKEIVVSPNQLGQDDIKVTGNVTDETGLGMPGVNVTVKGTALGTITDLDGKFTINVSSGDAILIFSFIGYETKEIALGGKTEINIQMEASLSELDEVVVIGYGTMTRSDLTGSVASVSSDDFEEQSSLVITDVLKGKSAGVDVSNLSGAPGGNVKIRIRGSNSLRQSNDPLVVVDGMILNIDFSDINVNEIENIDILKDASATAIYGSRGANGVIMITTKKGEGIQPKVKYNTFFSFNQVANKYELLDAADFAILVDSVEQSEIFDQAAIDSFRNYGGTNWQDLIFRSALTQNHQLSISGSNNKTNYYVSANYVNEEGIVINTYQNKFALRSNINTKVNDKFNIQFNAYLLRKNRHNVDDEGSKGGIVNQSLLWSPTEPVYEEDGTYHREESNKAYGSIFANPYMIANEKMKDVVISTALLNSKISYEIINGLTIDLFAGADFKNVKNYNFSNQWINQSNLNSNRQDREWLGWQSSNILTYKKAIEDFHKFTLMGGIEFKEVVYNQFKATGTNLSTPGVEYYALHLNENQSISSDYSRIAMSSYFGRLFYSFREMVLLTGTYRIDGSSKLSVGNKSDTFLSGAIGLRLSEIALIKNLGLVDNLKIRYSIGGTGSDDIPPYQSISTLNPISFSFGTETGNVGLTPGVSKDPNLVWEKTIQHDYGLDAAVLNNRIMFTADYYKKNTKDLLLEVPIPAYNGGGSVIQNIGEIENNGFEMALNVVPYHTSDFSWDIGFTFSTFKNTIKSLSDPEKKDTVFRHTGVAPGLIQENEYVWIEGESMGNLWGYKYLGPWRSNQEEEAAIYGAVPGMIRYEDINNDSSITSDDLTVIGNSYPDFIWGLNTTLKYKIFTLNLVFQGVHGIDKLNVSYAQTASINNESNSITLKEAKDYWTPENENSDWINPTVGNSKISMTSSQWVQDASYIKLKNISLSCSIDRKYIKVADLKLSASLQNWFTFTKYKGFDPEVTSTGDDDSASGIDIGSYPTPKSFIIGAKITF